MWSCKMAPICADRTWEASDYPKTVLLFERDLTLNIFALYLISEHNLSFLDYPLSSITSVTIYPSISAK